MLVQQVDAQLVGPPVVVGGAAGGVIERALRFGCHVWSRFVSSCAAKLRRACEGHKSNDPMLLIDGGYSSPARSARAEDSAARRFLRNASAMAGPLKGPCVLNRRAAPPLPLPGQLPGNRAADRAGVPDPYGPARRTGRRSSMWPKRSGRRKASQSSSRRSRVSMRSCSARCTLVCCFACHVRELAEGGGHLQA